MNLKQKKEEITNLLKKNKYNYDVVIFKLLREGFLDKILQKLDNKIVEYPQKILIKKGYLTAEEHFLYILDCFIAHFDNTFCITQDSFYLILKEMLSSKYCNIFLSKDEYSDSNLPTYLNEFDKIMIDPFIKNLKYLSENYDSSNTKMIIKILNKENNNFQYSKTFINHTIDFLKNILLCNFGKIQISTLFYNFEENIELNNIQKLNYFDLLWSLLCENYRKKRRAANIILN